jgi:hypothetical protein
MKAIHREHSLAIEVTPRREDFLPWEMYFCLEAVRHFLKNMVFNWRKWSYNPLLLIDARFQV